MKTLKGNIIELAKSGKFDVLVHGCGCHNTMDEGIGEIIKKEFPVAYRSDQASVKGDSAKMGCFTLGCHDRVDGSTLYIVNAYTQFKFWGEGRMVSYDAVREVFKKIAVFFPNKRIAYPLIGDSAKGDWKVISNIIDEELKGCNHTLVVSID